MLCSDSWKWKRRCMSVDVNVVKQVGRRVLVLQLKRSKAGWSRGASSELQSCLVQIQRAASDRDGGRCSTVMTVSRPLQLTTQI